MGPQYASAIFYTTNQQLQTAKEAIANLEKKLKKPVVTKLISAGVFWPAENEHINYYLNNPLEPYSLGVIQPKLREFSRAYKKLIKTANDYEPDAFCP